MVHIAKKGECSAQTSNRSLCELQIVFGGDGSVPSSSLTAGSVTVLCP